MERIPLAGGRRRRRLLLLLAAIVDDRPRDGYLEYPPYSLLPPLPLDANRDVRGYCQPIRGAAPRGAVRVVVVVVVRRAPAAAQGGDEPHGEEPVPPKVHGEGDRQTDGGGGKAGG